MPLPISSHLSAPAHRCTFVSLLGPWTWNRFSAIPFAVPLVTSVRYQVLVELTYRRQAPGRAVAQSWTGRRWLLLGWSVCEPGDQGWQGAQQEEGFPQRERRRHPGGAVGGTAEPGSMQHNGEELGVYGGWREPEKEE